jgi:hypothetical protein
MPALIGSSWNVSLSRAIASASAAAVGPEFRYSFSIHKIGAPPTAHCSMPSYHDAHFPSFMLGAEVDKN